MRRTAPGRHHRCAGVAIVAVLWMVVMAGLILMSLQRAASVELAAANGQVQTVQAHWLARAGVERAIAVLTDDGTSVDSAIDFWFDDELTFRDAEIVEDSGYTYNVVAPMTEGDDDTEQIRYGLIDAASRVNVNTADAKQLEALLDLDDNRIAAILDWRDSDKTARTGGAEQEYYDRLDFPYQVRNKAFVTMAELRLVRGIDRAVYYAEDVNGNGLLDGNEDDGETSGPPDNADGLLDVGLAGLTTVYSVQVNRTARGEERANLNEDDQQTLESKLNLTGALAKKVVERRGQGKFKSVFDLLEVRAPQQQAKSGDKDDEKVSQFTMKWIARHLDDLTLTKDGRVTGLINVNTASRRVLASLPEIDEAAAVAIASYRDSARGPFYSVGELFTDDVLNEKQFKAIAEKLAVRSGVFEVTSRGRTPGGVEQKIYAVLDRTQQPIRVLYWYQSE